MKEVMDFLTVSAVVAASIFFALLIEPILLEAALIAVDKGIRRNRGGSPSEGKLAEVHVNAIPVSSPGPKDRR